MTLPRILPRNIRDLFQLHMYGLCAWLSWASGDHRALPWWRRAARLACPAPAVIPAHRYGCWCARRVSHPWHRRTIPDVACGYDDRLTDQRCTGCHRSRSESPLDQLQSLDARHTVDGLGGAA